LTTKCRHNNPHPKATITARHISVISLPHKAKASWGRNCTRTSLPHPKGQDHDAQDARVHCVVLKIRAAPDSPRQVMPGDPGPKRSSTTPIMRPGKVWSLRTQQRARPHQPGPAPFHTPEGAVLSTKPSCEGHCQCSTHERHLKQTLECDLAVNPRHRMYTKYFGKRDGTCSLERR